MNMISNSKLKDNKKTVTVNIFLIFKDFLDLATTRINPILNFITGGGGNVGVPY